MFDSKIADWRDQFEGVCVNEKFGVVNVRLAKSKTKSKRKQIAQLIYSPLRERRADLIKQP